MNDDARNELISAYLDGELTADEQRRVEQLLVDSAEHRQLFEELRQLRASFEALPRYKLHENLSERVLRRAEQELLRDQPAEHISVPPVLATATTAGPAAGAGESHRPVVERSVDQQPRWPRSHSGRAIFWPAVAVAAALAMLVAGPKPRPEHGARTVAQTRNPLPDGQVKDQPHAEIGAAPDVYMAEGKAEAGMAAESPAEPESVAAGGAQAGQGPADRDSARRQERALRKTADSQMPADEKAGQSAAGEGRQPADLTAANAATEHDRADNADQAPALAQSRASGLAGGQGVGGAGGGFGGGGKGAPARGAPGEAVGQTQDALVASPAAPAPAPESLAFGLATGEASSEDAYVIDLELTPQAIREQAFDQLLLRNQLTQSPTANEAAAASPRHVAVDAVQAGEAMPAIRVQSPAIEAPAPLRPTPQLPGAQPGAAPTAVAEAKKVVDKEQLAVPAAAPQVAQDDTIRDEALGNAKTGKDVAAREAAEQNDLGRNGPWSAVVTVGATPEQFVATLHDLRQHPEQFANSSVAFAAAEPSTIDQTRLLSDTVAADTDQTERDQVGRGETDRAEDAQADGARAGNDRAGGDRSKNQQSAVAAPAAKPNREADKAKQQAEPQLKRDGVTVEKDLKARGGALARQSPAKQSATAGDLAGDQAPRGVKPGNPAAPDSTPASVAVPEGTAGVKATQGSADKVAGDEFRAPAGAAAKPANGRAPAAEAAPSTSTAPPTNTAPQPVLAGRPRRAAPSQLNSAASSPVTNQAAPSSQSGGLQLRNQQQGVELHLAPAQGVGSDWQGNRALGQAATNGVQGGDNLGRANKKSANTGQLEGAEPGAAANTTATSQTANSQTVRMIFRMRMADPTPATVEPASPNQVLPGAAP